MSLSISIKIFFKRLKKTYFAGDVNDVSYNPFPKSYDKFKLYNKNPKQIILVACSCNKEQKILSAKKYGITLNLLDCMYKRDGVNPIGNSVVQEYFDNLMKGLMK